MKKIIISSLLLLVLSTTTFSQIVNIEKKRKKSDGFQATIALDFNIKQSGDRILELKNNIDLQYSKNAHAFILLNNISLLSVNEGSLINNGFQHLRYNYTVKDSSFLTVEVFGQYQYNEQKLIQKRIIGGIGPRFRILNNDHIKWYFAPLVMYEFEKLSDELETEINLARLDAYLNLNISLNDLISFNLITYYQPDIVNFIDYRVSGEGGFRFKINKHLSYDTNFAIDYDNEPPPGVQNTFWYFKNKLIIKF